MRGEIWWVGLDPTVGAEANRVRTAVVVGRAALADRAVERGSGVVTVVPRNLMTELDERIRVWLDL